ncbi:MAG: UEV domain-containing protein [Benniella sp.]|nr:MAG: UEV domain-containing protein [Benniella sp.]
MDSEITDWLQKVLDKLGYHHRDRLYSDVEDVLRLFQNFLVPKAETYTHDNGRMQLLLSLIGTIPIVYQSATYNIPVAFWLPLSYPTVAPIVFVTPTALMLVKAGKYVDVSGRCYHPQLAFWTSDSNLVDLIGTMQSVFSQEPPVYAKTSLPPSQSQSSPSPGGGYPSPSSSLKPAPPILTYSPRLAGPSSVSSSSQNRYPDAASQQLNAQQTLLYTKLQAALHKFNSATNKETIDIVTVNKQLNDAESKTKTELQSLKDLNSKIQYNNGTLAQSIEQLNANIEQIRTWPEAQVDEIVCGSSVVHNQLFELVAEEIAIEDTIYYLGKALRQDKIGLNEYMKHLRNLSREQFMKKALIKKVKKHLHVE